MLYNFIVANNACGDICHFFVILSFSLSLDTVVHLSSGDTDINQLRLTTLSDAAAARGSSGKDELLPPDQPIQVSIIRHCVFSVLYLMFVMLLPPLAVLFHKPAAFCLCCVQMDQSHDGSKLMQEPEQVKHYCTHCSIVLGSHFISLHKC